MWIRTKIGTKRFSDYRKNRLPADLPAVYNIRMETKEKNNIIATLWRLCPVRHTLLCLSLLWLGAYFSFRDRRAWMNALYDGVVRPWHHSAGQVYSRVRFSAAEWIIALWVLMGVGFIAQLVVHFRRGRDRRALWRWGVTLLTLVALLFGLFCLWWGVCYYADSFTARSGLTRRAISVDELESVTRYFAALANEYAARVERDENGCFTADQRQLFDHSAVLYHALEQDFPCLSGPALRAKPAVFSRIMSYMNNTGYFFCFTAEANVNVDCPMALLPATIAHELAHQRGVAGEDESNFVAVAACLADGDPSFVYSGALMAYVYLGNALHSADYERWYAIYEGFNEGVRRDLSLHNAYWARYDTPVAEVTDKVYEQVLKTYGDDRGMKSYDACVDLLTVYYLEQAAN